MADVPRVWESFESESSTARAPLGKAVQGRDYRLRDLPELAKQAATAGREGNHLFRRAAY